MCVCVCVCVCVRVCVRTCERAYVRASERARACVCIIKCKNVLHKILIVDLT